MAYANPETNVSTQPVQLASLDKTDKQSIKLGLDALKPILPIPQKDMNAFSTVLPNVIRSFENNDRDDLARVLQTRPNKFSASMSTPSQETVLAAFDTQRNDVLRTYRTAYYNGLQTSAIEGNNGEETRAAALLIKQHSESIEKYTGKTEEDFMRDVKQKAGKEWWNEYGTGFLGICASAGFSAAAILAVSLSSDSQNNTNETPAIKQQIIQQIIELLSELDKKLKKKGKSDDEAVREQNERRSVLNGLVGEKNASDLIKEKTTPEQVVDKLTPASAETTHHELKSVPTTTGSVVNEVSQAIAQSHDKKSSDLFVELSRLGRLSELNAHPELLSMPPKKLAGALGNLVG